MRLKNVVYMAAACTVRDAQCAMVSFLHDEHNEDCKTIFHNLVFVAIDKQYPGQAYKVMNAMWGMGLMSLAKVVVIVDKDVNVRDPDEHGGSR